MIILKMFRICALFLVFMISSYALAEDGENGSSPTSWVEGTTTKPGEDDSSLKSWVEASSTHSVGEDGSSQSSWVEKTTFQIGEKSSSLPSRVDGPTTLPEETGSSLRSWVEGTSTLPEEKASSLKSWIKGASTQHGEKGSSLRSWVEGITTQPSEKSSSLKSWVERTSTLPGEKGSSLRSLFEGTSTQADEKSSSVISRFEGSTTQSGEQSSSTSRVEGTTTATAQLGEKSLSSTSKVEEGTTSQPGEKSSSTNRIERTTTSPGEKSSSTSRVERTTTPSGESVSSLTGWVEGTSTESGESTKIFFGQVPNSKSEIVIRDLKDVSVHCQADYPVQLNFKSHTGFKLLATGSGASSRFFQNNTHQFDVQQHTNYAHLVSLKEAYTGLYTCKGRGSKTKTNSISIYIYVPTEKIFISTKTAMLSADHNPLVIPCPIADPNATVSLVKLHEDEIVKSVSNASYNPKVGFTLEKTSTDVDGTYYCIAKTKENHRAVGFTVVKGPVECTKRCLENSKCQLVNEQQVCECNSGYKETFVSEKCLKQCKTDKDCPSNMACMPQESGSFLLEILSSVSSGEGKQISSFLKSSSSSSSGEDEGKEDEDDGHHDKAGECKNPCIFRTTSCSLGESRNINEVCQVKEHKAVCQV